MNDFLRLILEFKRFDALYLSYQEEALIVKEPYSRVDRFVDRVLSRFPVAQKEEAASLIRATLFSKEEGWGEYLGALIKINFHLVGYKPSPLGGNVFSKPITSQNVMY